MTPEEMQDMIDNCTRMIADCKRWIAWLEGASIPDGHVSHPVGDTTEPSEMTTDAAGRAIWVRSGKLVALGER